MSEERIYFNDEWNLNPSEIIEKYYKVLDKKGNPQNIYLRDEDKYFIDNFRQLSCQCSLPKPNSFTGNCTNCGKIIKPIRETNVSKYTK